MHVHRTRPLLADVWRLLTASVANTDTAGVIIAQATHSLPGIFATELPDGGAGYVGADSTCFPFRRHALTPSRHSSAGLSADMRALPQ